jgi:hypothetical protein
VGFEPKISVGERPAAAHLLRSCIYDINHLRVKVRDEVE